VSARLRLAQEADKIESNRKKKIKRATLFLIPIGVLFLIFIFNIYIFKIAIIFEFQIIFLFIGPIFSGFVLVFISHSDKDRVFLKMMETLELLDKDRIDPEVREDAAEKLEEAIDGLERFLRSQKDRLEPSWYSEVKELEKDFIDKLKHRAVPALRDRSLATTKTENLTMRIIYQIALVFISPDIKQMEIVNDLLEDYDEILPDIKDEISLISRVSSTADIMYRSIPLTILSIIFGNTGFLILMFIYSLFTTYTLIDLILNPELFILGSLTASSWSYLILKNRSPANFIDMSNQSILPNFNMSNQSILPNSPDIPRSLTEMRLHLLRERGEIEQRQIKISDDISSSIKKAELYLIEKKHNEALSLLKELPLDIPIIKILLIECLIELEEWNKLIELIKKPKNQKELSIIVDALNKMKKFDIADQKILEYKRGTQVYDQGFIEELERRVRAERRIANRRG